MKCIYYISPTLKSTKEISEDLHAIGVDDWYLHIVSKDEGGLARTRLHSRGSFRLSLTVLVHYRSITSI